MAEKNSTLRGLIQGAVYDLLPKTNVYNVWVDSKTTLAAKLSEVIISLNGKVTQEQLATAIEEALADFDGGVSPEQVAEAIESAILENGIIKRSLLPEGYPYTGFTEIFPEQSLAFTEEFDYQAPLPHPIGLVAGGTYEVSWNGTVYSCVAESAEMEGVPVVIMGDLGAMSGEPTGTHPFIVMELPPDMAAEMGGVYGVIMPLDGSESAVVSIRGGGNIPIDRKWLPEGYPYIIEGGTTVLEETTLTDSDGGAFTIPVALNTGATYKVTWNGTDYIVSPVSFANDSYSGAYWGDGSLFSGEPSEEPFTIAVISSMGQIVMANDGSAAPTIKIVTEKSYVPMSEKYLSTGGLRLVNGKASGSIRSTNAKPEDETYKLGRDALAIGTDAQSDGIHSIALGEGATASAWYSVAIGTNVTSGDDRSIVIGCESNSYGAGNIIIGTGCTSGPVQEGLNIFGRYNDTSSMGLFTVGNGTSDSERSNAFKVGFNGVGWFQSGLNVGTKSVLLYGDTAPNPNALTFTGAVEGTYDGSEALTINIPSGSVVTPGDYTGTTTEQFRQALASNRRVFVPGGTYTLDGELVIRDNCELELAQDVVLKFTQTTGNCISLKQLAHLKGNHASIQVPYEFTGNVINADTGLTTSVNECPPFAKWDPMWKNGRYVTNINILKPDSRGFHYSVDGKCNGTAVYLCADGNDTTTWLWGINFSGLRIAGAFTYGIHAENFGFEDGDGGWNHEMRIEAFIDGCEVGVQMDNCHNAYLSTIVQPRRAYTTDAQYIPYAKWGICLNNSRNCDMKDARVWDWDSEKTLWSEGSINQHLALLGDCRGAILNEFYYYSNPSYDIRSLIYTDTPANLERLTIIQEPFTRWFKPVDHEPYFFDGDANQKIVLQEDLNNIVDAETVANFTNALPLATDNDGSVFNGIGYAKSGYELLNDGNVTAGVYSGVTGFIPIAQNDVIYAKNISLLGSTVAVVIYDADKAYIQHAGPDNLAGMTYFFDYTTTEDGFILKVKERSTVSYIRFGYGRTQIGERPIISVNNPIEYTASGYLKEGIKVTASQVDGLSEILGSYIDDVDALIGGDS